MGKAETGVINIHGRDRRPSTALNGYDRIVSIGGRGGKTEYLHRMVAELALGRKLKGEEEVHHVDGNRNNNTNENLVICPNRGYHMLLHSRARAIEFGGNADAVLCEYCGNYGAEKERQNRKGRGWHLECKRSYERKKYHERKLNAC